MRRVGLAVALAALAFVVSVVILALAWVTSVLDILSRSLPDTWPAVIGVGLVGLSLLANLSGAGAGLVVGRRISPPAVRGDPRGGWLALVGVVVFGGALGGVLFNAMIGLPVALAFDWFGVRLVPGLVILAVWASLCLVMGMITWPAAVGTPFLVVLLVAYTAGVLPAVLLGMVDPGLASENAVYWERNPWTGSAVFIGYVAPAVLAAASAYALSVERLFVGPVSSRAWGIIAFGSSALLLCMGLTALDTMTRAALSASMG